MGRIPKKTAYWVAKKRRAGELQAEREFYKKEPLKEKLKRWLFKKLSEIDPIEVAGIAAGTFIIHSVLEKSQPVLTLVDLISPTRQAELISTYWIPAFQSLITGSGQKEVIESMQKRFSQSDMTLWLVSFVLAVLLIKHGGDLLGLGEKGVVGLATLILG